MLRRLRGLSDAMLAADPILAPAEVDTARDELGELARAFAGLQQRLAQQEDARRMFVATASHELRTPLTSLQNLLELTVDEPDPDRVTAGRPPGAGPGAAAERAQQGPARPLPPRRGRAAARRADRAGRAVPSGRGRVRSPALDRAPEPCWAIGDPEGVARIVRLLVDNAVRYAPQAPIEVRAERSTATSGARARRRRRASRPKSAR